MIHYKQFCQKIDSLDCENAASIFLDFFRTNKNYDLYYLEIKKCAQATKENIKIQIMHEIFHMCNMIKMNPYSVINLREIFAEKTVLTKYKTFTIYAFEIISNPFIFYILLWKSCANIPIFRVSSSLYYELLENIINEYGKDIDFKR